MDQTMGKRMAQQHTMSIKWKISLHVWRAKRDGKEEREGGMEEAGCKGNGEAGMKCYLDPRALTHQMAP
jgi:hypothetical protein